MDLIGCNYWPARRRSSLSELTWNRTELAAATGFEAAPLNPLIIAHISEAFLDIRAVQKPLKDHYRQDRASSLITLTARGTQTDAPISCSIDLGRQIYQAQAHKGVGGAGTGACSGDLLLGALAACAQITCQMVATSMGISTDGIDVTVEGDLDLQGTLGISKEVPVGFQSIRAIFDIRAPLATPEQLNALREKTEQYCVVMQTLLHPPNIESKWATK